MTTGPLHAKCAASGEAVSFFNRVHRLLRDLLSENERLRAEVLRLRRGRRIASADGAQGDGDAAAGMEREARRARRG